MADVSGNGHTGTITGVTWTTSGKFGNAVTFNGTSNRVTVADAADLDLTTGMTLEAWVYPTATQNTWSSVIMKEQSGGLAYTLYTGSPANRPKGYLFTSSEQSVAGTAAVAVNTWSHFAATYDCTTLRLYVDGFQVASQAIAGGAITNSTGALRLGGNSVWGEYFQGRIDDVRLYNRDLAQSEIQADMATGVIGGPESAGIYRGGWWYLDTNGNNG